MFRLALRAGGSSIVDPERLWREMSAETWMEWIHYYNLEPFGEDRADWRAAQIAALIAETNRDRKKRPKPYTVQDFMPRFEPPKPPREQTPQEQAGILQMWSAALQNTKSV